MIWLFMFVFVSIFIVNKRITKSIINGFTIVFLPYAFIVFVNNLLLDKLFYDITNECIILMISAMLIYEWCFLILYCFGFRRFVKLDTNFDGSLRFEPSLINFKGIYIFVTIVLLIRFAYIVYLFFYGGIAALSANDYESLALDPITGRLEICLFPAGWIIAFKLFVYKNYSKKESFFCKMFLLLITLELFLGAVKAHAMIFILCIYIISICGNRRNILLGFGILVSMVILMFFGNYALAWFAIDRSVPTAEYTITHFWKYLAGANINVGYAIRSGTTTYGFLDFWISVLSPIPNEFLSVIGEKIVPSGSIPYVASYPLVSKAYYETNNVVTLFGRMYGSGNPIGYFFNVVIFSIVTEKSLFKLKYGNSINQFIISATMVSYSFLSFFSNYYATSHFWQIIIYSYLFCSFVTKFRFGKRNW